jgi:hypothetical protein
MKNGRANGSAADEFVDDIFAPPKPFDLLHFAEMRPRLTDGGLIKGLIGSTGMSVVYGQPGSGKTFLALYVGFCIASGMPFFGRRVRQAGVIYVAAEAGPSLANRVAAAKMETEFPQVMPFAAITCPVNLCTVDVDTERLIATIKAVDLGVPAGLIIIDTVSRAFGGGNENAPDDMGAFVGNVDKVRAATGIAVTGVHHSGKDLSRGARGHNLLFGAVDTEIEVTQDKETKISTAKVTKQRDYATEGTFVFSLRSVSLGMDEDYEPVTSCVVVEEDESAAPQKQAARLSPAQQCALRLLAKAIDDAGAPAEASNHIPSGTRCVTEDLWRRYCYQGGISEGDQEAKKKAFKRASEGLIATGRVSVWQPYVWVP